MSENSVLDVDFTGVSDKPDSKFPEKIKPGVYDFMISGMEFGEQKNDRKTPYVEMTVLASNNLEHKERFYITSKALPRLKHVMLNCGNSPESLDTKLTRDQIKKMTVGKSFRAILGGRKFEKNNNIYIAPEFGFLEFAAPIGNTTLVFDPSKHIRDLERNPNTVSTASSNTSDNIMEAPSVDGDLPF